MPVCHEAVVTSCGSHYVHYECTEADDWCSSTCKLNSHVQYSWRHLLSLQTYSTCIQGDWTVPHFCLTPMCWTINIYLNAHCKQRSSTSCLYVCIKIIAMRLYYTSQFKFKQTKESHWTFYKEVLCFKDLLLMVYLLCNPFHTKFLHDLAHFLVSHISTCTCVQHTICSR